MKIYLVINPAKIKGGVDKNKIMRYLRLRKKRSFSVDDAGLERIMNNDSPILSKLREHRKVEVLGYGSPEELKKIVSEFPYCPKKVIINNCLCFY